MKNIRQIKSKSPWWQKGLMIGIIFTLGLMSLGCNKENEENNSDEYYVTYELSSSTIYYGGKLDVVISTDNNISETFVVNQRQNWEVIIGPVQKGFKASLSANATGNTYNHLRLYTNIYVSKNGSPFALKKSNGSDEPRDAVQINYTIDN
jgi:hypothetical protein